MCGKFIQAMQMYVRARSLAGTSGNSQGDTIVKYTLSWEMCAVLVPLLEVRME